MMKIFLLVHHVLLMLRSGFMTCKTVLGNVLIGLMLVPSDLATLVLLMLNTIILVKFRLGTLTALPSHTVHTVMQSHGGAVVGVEAVVVAIITTITTAGEDLLKRLFLQLLISPQLSQILHKFTSLTLQ
jgi:hypothetical protein